MQVATFVRSQQCLITCISLGVHRHPSCHAVLCCAVPGEAEVGSTLQEAAASEQQARSEAESQLKAVRESAQLDFERIGALSEENAKLQVCVDLGPWAHAPTGSVW